MEQKLEVLQAALDKYIREQRECGNPARRQDVIEFCQLTNLSVGYELPRVGYPIDKPIFVEVSFSKHRLVLNVMLSRELFSHGSVFDLREHLEGLLDSEAKSYGALTIYGEQPIIRARPSKSIDPVFEVSKQYFRQV